MNSKKEFSKNQKQMFNRETPQFTKKGKTIKIYSYEYCAGADRVELNKSVKAKVDKNVEELIAVVVRFDKEGKKYRVPTKIYVKKSEDITNRL